MSETYERGFSNYSPQAFNPQAQLLMGEARKRDFTLLIGGDSGPWPIWEPVPYEHGPLPGFRPVEGVIGLKHGGGRTRSEGYSEAAGTAVEAGSLLSDKFKLPEAVGLDGKLGILLTISMAQAETSGWTGQAEIVTVDATKVAVVSARQDAVGAVLELDKTILAASPSEPLVPKKQFTANRLHALIADLDKADKVVEVERTVVRRGIKFIGGHAGKSGK